MTSLRNDDNDELGIGFNNKVLKNISADENTANAPQDEDAKHRRIQRLKNTNRAKHRQNAQAHAKNPPLKRNLNAMFAGVGDNEYVTPIGNIAQAAMLLQQLPQNLETQRILRLTRWAIIQLDRLLVQHKSSRSERHGSTIPVVSHNPRGRPRPRNNANGQQDHEVQQLSLANQ